jgi:hypothetical protein
MASHGTLDTLNFWIFGLISVMRPSFKCVEAFVFHSQNGTDPQQLRYFSDP